MAISQQQRTELLTLLVGMFDAAPGSDILDELANGIDNGNTIAQYAANLVESSEFTGIYSRALTAEEFASSFIANLLGSTVDADTTAEAEAFVAGRLNAGASRDTVIIEALTELSAVAEDDATWGAAAAQLNNKVEVAEYFGTQGGFTGLTLSQMQAALSGVTNDDATVTAKKAAIDSGDLEGVGTSGQTFTLTTAADSGVSFTGTSGNDTFNANVAVNPATGIAEIETLTAIDSIDGGAGTDTLNYTTVGGTALVSSAFTNIENVNIVSDGDVTADVSSNSAVQNITAKVGTDADIDTSGNVTSVALTGTSESVDITDNATTKTLTSVSITGAGNTAGDNAKAVNSTALTSLSLTNITGTENDDDADGISTDTTQALTLGLNNVVIGEADILAATATSATVNVTGTSAVTVDDLDFSAATTATINQNSTKTFTVDGLDVAAVTTLDINGSGKTVLTAGTYTALTTVDATGSTGGVTMTAALDNADQFLGGAGADEITVAATTKAQTLGAGDDTVNVTVAALGTGGSLEGGDGTDTLAMSVANAETATASTTFEDSVSNFEKLSLGAVAADSGVEVINLANLDNINYIVSAGITGNDGGDALTLNNVVTGGTFELTGDNAAAEDGVTINVSGSATNDSDVFNLHLNTGTTAGVIVADSITIANVETVNISTQDGETSTAPVAASTHTATLVSTSATTIVVSGNNGLNLTNTGNTAITSFDASAVKADTAADTAANLAVTFVSDNVTSSVTMTGGEGNDTLTSDSASTKGDTLNGGAGNDTLTGAAGNDTLNGGDGNDTLVSNKGQDTLTGGAGNDDFQVGVSTSGTVYATITDLSAGDMITLAAGLGNAFTTTAVTAGANAVFQDYLDAAAGTADTAAWFQFNGNTYVIGSADATGGFTNGTDTVVEITGLVDLSTATISNDVLTIA